MGEIQIGKVAARAARGTGQKTPRLWAMSARDGESLEKGCACR